MARFGDFAPLCRQVPSYPWCNLFFRQLQRHDTSALRGFSADPASAPVGINPECGIPRLGQNSSLGNIANIIACALGILFTLFLILKTHRRKAAVGRAEFRIFLFLYLLSLPLQLISTGALLAQGSTALTVITAIHAGVVAATFWALLASAIVSTQVVEDGTISSLLPFYFFIAAFFAATTYISLDTAFTWNTVFGPSTPPSDLNDIALFVLTSIWPGAAALIYFGLMLYIVLVILQEVRPMWYYVLAAILFILSQLDYFLLSKVICRGASSKVDGSFIATILETAAVGLLYTAWTSITEATWSDGYSPY